MADKIRFSNLELLRILAMLGVLTVHADFGAIGYPDSIELKSAPVFCISRVFIEAFAIVAVNVFVLISGWFGITFRKKGLLNLLFQCAFFFFGIYAVCVMSGIIPFDAKGIMMCLMMTSNAWFVKCYLGLFILAPVLNAYAETAGKKQFQLVLIAFFVFQTFYGWISDGASWIAKGYSTFSFVGIYLLARYVRIHKPAWSRWSAKRDSAAYAALSVLTAVIMLVFISKDHFLFFNFTFYTSPLIIAAALFIVLAFSKLSFQNSVINWIAASSFSIYLFHFILFPTFMSPWIRAISENYSGIRMFAYIALLLLAFYSAATLLDKVRLFVWKHWISKLIK